jgi:hypothetical protein
MPVTSFRWLPDVIGATEFRPLAFYPLALLVPVLILYLFKTRSFRFPIPAAPLVGFLLIAIISTVIGGLYAPLDLRGQTYWRWALRAWLSLGVGMGFFWVSVLLSRSEEFLQRTLPWLYAGLAVTVVWGILQAVAQNTALISVGDLNKVQLAVSIRGIVRRRVSGFAFEPSWLADQITILYFPWLFAALMTRFRVTKYKWLEPVLALSALVLLLLTYSRSGVIGLLVSVGVALLTVGRGLIARVWNWFRAPFRSSEDAGRWKRVVILLLVLLLLVAALWWMNRFDYFSSLWEADFSKGVIEYVRAIAAAPRLAYFVAGIDIFNLHPWLGVGLGGSNFYLFDHLPTWAFSNPYEIAIQFSPESNLIPNVRSLMIRLLAETGIVGFWMYLAFLISILGSIRRMYLTRQNALVYISVAGIAAWSAVCLRQFTLSSLTAPVIWTSLGMIVGYAHHTLEVNPKTGASGEQFA